MISRRKFIRVVGGGVVLAAGGVALARCDRMPDDAIVAWGGPAEDDKDVRRRILSFAILAPSPHNQQPWLVDLATPNKIVLYCDRTRLLPETDPFSRQILIGHGTFLELLDMAAGATGYRADIRTFPEGVFGPQTIDDRPVAEIAVVKDPDRQPDPLFRQVLERRTNRATYDTERPLVSEHLEALRRLALDAAVRLTVATDQGLVSELRTLVTQGLITELRTPRAFGESIDLMRIGAAEIALHRDGISIHGPMMWWLRKFGVLSRAAMRDPNSRSFQVGIDMARDQGGSGMAFAWLTTGANTRTTQLEAGRAYLRLHLKATELGVAQHPMSQLLQEYEEIRDLQARFLKAAGAKPGETVQMLARLGYASAPEPAPRRPLVEMIRS